MPLKNPGSWLFLLSSLPAKQSSYRVRLWRQLKKFGAVQLKTLTYVLPDEPVHYERFQLLAKEIVDSGGEGALARNGILLNSEPLAHMEPGKVPLRVT
jgi:hypothetical protein